MKKYFTFYLLLCFSSLPCFAQYFQAGDVQLGYKIARQKQLQVLADQLDFYALQKRQILAAEYHVVENVSFYATYDITSKTSFFDKNEKTNTTAKYKAWSVGGRRFSTGLFHGHLYFYGDLGYGQFTVAKTKIDVEDDIELKRTDEHLRVFGFAGGLCIKPSRHFSIDLNLFRIGAFEQILTTNAPFDKTMKTYNSGLLVGIPLSSSIYESSSIRLNFIFSTQKNKTDEELD